MSPISNKFIAKYMRLCLHISKDNVPCLSRGVGAVIIDIDRNAIISVGYNGPPKGLPNCDSPEYVENYLLPMLTEQEKERAKTLMGDCWSKYQSEFDDSFTNFICDAKACPRKTLGYQSGERLELCTCAHAEQNAIDVAGQNLHGTAIFVSAGVPCFYCCRDIINSGIKYVYCLGNDYPKAEISTWMLKRAGITVFNVNPEWINNEKDDKIIKFRTI